MRYVFLFLFMFSSIAYAQFDEHVVDVVDDSSNISVSKPKFQATNDKNIADVFISLVIPGWSFFKKKEYVKGAAFVVADVAAISGYVYFSKKGDDELQRSIDYADANYSVEKFEQFNDTVLHSDRFDLNPFIIPYSDSIGHVFHYDDNGNVIKDLNYYEMIGKYEKFVQGWSDTDPHFNTIIEEYGNIYVPKMNSDSVQVYDSKYPDSPTNKFILTDDKSFHYVLMNEMIRFDHTMQVPVDDFYYGKSDKALYYMTIRDQSNTYNEYANMMLWVVAINHLTSFGFSIYHMVSDDKIVSENGEVEQSSFTLYPTVDLETKSRGVNLQWQF